MSGEVQDFSFNTQHEDIVIAMTYAINSKIDTICDALTAELKEEDAAGYLQQLRTKNQGVYAGLVTQLGNKQAYIGSAYGKCGLENRVFSQHCRAAYRA
jgi:hypothetical protein